jgi:acyl carrier protein
LDWRADWSEGLTLTALRQRLTEGAVGPLGVRGVPNARTALHGATASLLFRDVREGAADAEGVLAAAKEAARGAVEPQDLWDLGRELGWEVELGWSEPGSDGRFEAVFRRLDIAAEPLSLLLPPPSGSPGASSAWRDWTTDPQRGRLARRLAPELREYLAARVPDYMLPTAFVPLASLPLTPNGKVDRKALARLAFASELGEGKRSGAGPVAPRTPVEEKLAAIWADLLKVPRVGAEDDFFALGGHSLLATQVVSRVRDAFGVELPLRALFEAPTVAGLAREVSAALRAGNGTQPPPIRPVCLVRRKRTACRSPSPRSGSGSSKSSSPARPPTTCRSPSISTGSST